MASLNGSSQINRSLIKFKNIRYYCAKRASVKIFELTNSPFKIIYFLAYSEIGSITHFGHSIMMNI